MIFVAFHAILKLNDTLHLKKTIVLNAKNAVMKWLKFLTLLQHILKAEDGVEASAPRFTR